MKQISSVHLPPLAVLVVGILAASTAAIFIRVAQKEASSLVIAAARLMLAELILLPLAWKDRGEFLHLPRQQVLMLLLSGLFLGLHFASWISSLAFTSVAGSVVLVSTTPVWVALVSFVFLREKVSRSMWVGLVVALVGVGLVGLGESCQINQTGLSCAAANDQVQARALIGDLLALLGGIMAAGYLLLGRKLRPHLSLTPYITAVYGVAALILLAMAGMSGQKMSGFSVPVYLCFFALALFPQLIGHSSFNYALRYLPAAFVSVALLGEPVGSTILALVFLREIPTGIELLGGGIILAGIVLATYPRADS